MRATVDNRKIHLEKRPHIFEVSSEFMMEQKGPDCLVKKIIFNLILSQREASC